MNECICCIIYIANIGNGEYNPRVNRMEKLKFENKDNICIDSASCGYLHIAILSPSNDLICFGRNNRKQCSTKTEERRVIYPHILSKNDELKCIKNDYIEKVIAIFDATIIITNSYKN